MKKIISLVLVLVVVLSLSACSKGADYTEINNQELIEMLNSSEDYQFLDVRTLDEYNTEKIAGFEYLIDVYKLELDHSMLDRLDKDKPVVVMCNSGNRSLVAIEILWENGFTQLYNLTDGIQGWINEGYETE